MNLFWVQDTIDHFYVIKHHNHKFKLTQYLIDLKQRSTGLYGLAPRVHRLPLSVTLVNIIVRRPNPSMRSTVHQSDLLNPSTS